jgi:hypothetical protein
MADKESRKQGDLLGEQIDQRVSTEMRLMFTTIFSYVVMGRYAEALAVYRTLSDAQQRQMMEMICEVLKLAGDAVEHS